MWGISVENVDWVGHKILKGGGRGFYWSSFGLRFRPSLSQNIVNSCSLVLLFSDGLISCKEAMSVLGLLMVEGDCFSSRHQLLYVQASKLQAVPPKKDRRWRTNALLTVGSPG